MSAYLCSDKHIATIVNSAIALCGHLALRDALPWRLLGPGALAAQEAADLLKKTNTESVNYRYQQDEVATPCKLESQKTTAAGALKLLDCLEYQSCERPDWVGSDGYYLLRGLRSALIRALPGYDAAPRSID